MFDSRKDRSDTVITLELVCGDSMGNANARRINAPDS